MGLYPSVTEKRTLISHYIRICKLSHFNFSNVVCFMAQLVETCRLQNSKSIRPSRENFGKSSEIEATDLFFSRRQKKKKYIAIVCCFTKIGGFICPLISRRQMTDPLIVYCDKMIREFPVTRIINTRGSTPLTFFGNSTLF